MQRVSLRTAIDTHCRDCIHDPLCPGTWRQQVARCEAVSCALWPIRAGAATSPLPQAVTVQIHGVKPPKRTAAAVHA